MLMGKFGWGGALALTLVATATAGQAQDDDRQDALARTLGCETSPEISPYCSDLDLRVLRAEHNLMRLFIATKPEIQVTQDMDLGPAGLFPAPPVLDAIQDRIARDVNGCQGDRDCMIKAMHSTDALLRQLAGIAPPPQPVNTAAEEEEVRPDPAAVAALLDAEYAQEWEAARVAVAALGPSDRRMAMFRWNHPEPADWSQKRRDQCNAQPECLTARPRELDMLIRDRETALRDARIRAHQAKVKAQQEERAAALRLARENAAKPTQE